MTSLGKIVVLKHHIGLKLEEKKTNGTHSSVRARQDKARRLYTRINLLLLLLLLLLNSQLYSRMHYLFSNIRQHGV